MASRWSYNLLKGRIGEAVIEAVLTEFGYRVRRAGYELAVSGIPRYAPDLVVEYPPSGERAFVEVKYRSARPTSVLLNLDQTLEYKMHYPGTIIAICSAWSGAIFCTKVEDLPAKDAGGAQALSLLDDYWKPISHFFPNVQRGDRLQRLWKELKETLKAFGGYEIAGRGAEKLWDTEYEDLTRYLTDNWNEQMLEVGIEEPKPENMTLEQLWEKVRHIDAVFLASDLLGPSEENQIESNTMLLAIMRAKRERGEGNITFDIGAFASEFGLDSDETLSLGNFVAGLMKPHESSRLKDFVQGIVENMADGVGDVYLMDPALPFKQTERVDLKTALKLTISPCRIDR